MKLAAFEALAPKCIVCGAKMKRTITPAFSDLSKNKKKEKSMGDDKQYNVNMVCLRNEKCFGYMSNVVSTRDPIEVNKFYISFPKVQLFAVVDEYTQVLANGSIMKLSYIPFNSWLRAWKELKSFLYWRMENEHN